MVFWSLKGVSITDNNYQKVLQNVRFERNLPLANFQQTLCFVPPSLFGPYHYFPEDHVCCLQSYQIKVLFSSECTCVIWKREIYVDNLNRYFEFGKSGIYVLHYYKKLYWPNIKNYLSFKTYIIRLRLSQLITFAIKFFHHNMPLI